jgi:hypothetical protein
MSTEPPIRLSRANCRVRSFWAGRFANTSEASQVQSADQNGCASDRENLVAASLERMLTIKPGMTREQQLRVFATGGGTSGGKPPGGTPISARIKVDSLGATNSLSALQFMSIHPRNLADRTFVRGWKESTDSLASPRSVERPELWRLEGAHLGI